MLKIRIEIQKSIIPDILLKAMLYFFMISAITTIVYFAGNFQLFTENTLNMLLKLNKITTAFSLIFAIAYAIIIYNPIKRRRNAKKWFWVAIIVLILSLFSFLLTLFVISLTNEYSGGFQ